MKQLLLLFSLFLSAATAQAQTDITFCVDMTSIADAPDFAAQAIAFDFNSFNSGSTPLSDPDGDNIFCGTFSLAAGEVRFNFFAAAADGAGGPENLDPLLGQSCVNNTDGQVKRTFTVTAGVPETLFFVWESCDGTLPVTLANFSGEALDKHNRFYWTTATEENVQWHILDRSNDGRNNWQEVARTQGAMFTTEEQGYSLDDTAPPASAYYRLRSVDYDGSEGISDILQLVRTPTTALRVYPNPVGDRLEVSLQVETPTQTRLLLIAADGRVISAIDQELAIGLNQLSLDLTDVPAGIYILRVGEETMTVVKR